MNLDETKKYAIKLIRELRLQAKKWGAVLLLVRFPEDSRAVWNGWPGCLQQLQKMLLDGGIPVGMIICQYIDGEWHYFYSVLEERVNDEWSATYMESFIARMAAPD